MLYLLCILYPHRVAGFWSFQWVILLRASSAQLDSDQGIVPVLLIPLFWPLLSAIPSVNVRKDWSIPFWISLLPNQRIPICFCWELPKTETTMKVLRSFRGGECGILIRGRRKYFWAVSTLFCAFRLGNYMSYVALWLWLSTPNQSSEVVTWFALQKTYFMLATPWALSPFLPTLVPDISFYWQYFLYLCILCVNYSKIRVQT